jgi:nicotinate-nucleotide adenylyltransferase
LRTGILGGAFNPPHIGHLVCAQEALLRLELDTVVFVPMGVAPHREIEDDPGPEARLLMTERAIANDHRFALSRHEVERPEPSFTVDTLRAFRERSPGDELVLILGGDQAATLPAWREPEEVLRLATVAVAARTAFSRERVEASLAPLAGADAIVFIDMPRVDVSSSLVRERAAAGEPIRYLVPDEVASYIAAESLYGASTPSPA